MRDLCRISLFLYLAVLGCGQGTLEPKKIPLVAGLSDENLDEFFTEKQSGVQVYFKFDETLLDSLADGKDFKDSSGRNLHASVVGAVNPILDLTGIRGRATEVKDLVGSLQVDRIITDSIQQMSFGIWLKYNGTPQAAELPIFHSGQPGVDGFGIWLSDGIGAGGGNQVVLRPDPAQSDTLVSDVTLTSDTWTQVFVTYSATNGWKLYVNGVLASAGGVLPPSSPTTETIFGAFPGLIDEFIYWKEEMTAEDVMNIYLIQSGQL